MGGFDNGTLQNGLAAQVKQFGSILRGLGPPVPGAGVVGDLYLDTLSWFLYEKRANVTDPWGHYLFQVPATYRNQLKWFSSALPTDDVGVLSDYCLAWGGYSNYGLGTPSVYGPKSLTSWNEGGNGPNSQIDPSFAGGVYPLGLADEGTVATYSTSGQLIVVGVTSEYVLALPATPNANDPVTQFGLQSQAGSMAGTVTNPLLTATDSHGV